MCSRSDSTRTDVMSSQILEIVRLPRRCALAHIFIFDVLRFHTADDNEYLAFVAKGCVLSQRYIQLEQNPQTTVGD